MDNQALKELLLGEWAEARLYCREVAKNPDLHYIPGLPYQEHRQRVLNQVAILRDSGVVSKAFPSQYGGADDFGGHIAGFEELLITDPSLQIKSGVQYGLFTAAIQHLGTKTHHDKYLTKAINLDMLGCYAMTESGHGSDVFNIQTTATYDKATDEFIINTPNRNAWKDYLGNAALHGRWAVVFAQLNTNGESHGVHSFLVPIRDENGIFLEGVTGSDDGVKGGLNGIDNGRLCFTNVRIPRTELLNRYGSVDTEGNYESNIANPKRRFFVMLGTLVQGRVSLDGAAVVASKLALQIAITYANNRRQFMNSKNEEVLLMDYQSHQRRLLPLLAETYAASFAHEELLAEFNTVFEKLTTSTGDETEGMQELETHAAVLKAVNTWHALDTLGETRQACGGNGFLQENRIAQLRSDFDIYVTFEGDNTVLCQLVGKRLLTDYASKMKHASLSEKIQHVTKDIVEKTRLKFTSLNHSKTIQELLRTRVEIMTASITNTMYHARKNNVDMEQVFNKNQSNIIDLAKAYGDLLRWEAFDKVVRSLPNTGEWNELNELKKLYGWSAVQKNLAWFLAEGFVTPAQGKEINSIVDELLEKVRPSAQEFVNAFGYEPEHLRAKMLE